MNEELIQKLVDQCVDKRERNGRTVEVLQSRKFAELIVRECIEVFSKDMPDPTSPDYKLGSLEEVVNRVCNVAEHFGVEE